MIGITGVTCGGKTSLSKKLINLINQHAQYSKFKINVKVISQDDYFLDVEDKRHVWVEEIQHIHFDIITSIDMDQMYKDILTIIANQPHYAEHKSAQENGSQDKNQELILFLQGLQRDVNILIIEGFSIYEHAEVYELCDLKYFFTLDYEECKRRRLLRVYEPPDCPGYFELCVWPEYLKYLQLVQVKSEENKARGVTFFESNSVDRSVQVFKDIFQQLKN